MFETITRIANILKWSWLDKQLERIEIIVDFEKVTVSDCQIAYQMGYETQCNDGKIIKMRRV